MARISSAGGHLATVAALAARDRGGPPLALQVLVHPAADACRPRNIRSTSTPAATVGIRYAAKLRAAGIPVIGSHYPAMIHGFSGFPELLADARAAQRSAAEVVASAVSGRKKSGEDGGGAG